MIKQICIKQIAKRFIDARVTLYAITTLSLASCYPNQHKQPGHLASEIVLFDSLKRQEPFTEITRHVRNIDSTGIEILGSDWRFYWNSPYCYNIFMETRDSAFFSRVDTAYASQLFETMCRYIPKEQLQDITLYMAYVYDEEHRSVAHAKRYYLRREGNAFIFYDRYPN